VRTYVDSTDQSQRQQFSDKGDKFRDCLNDVARHFFGTPNRALCNMHVLRWNERGSFCVDTRKGSWFDFEANEGGGTLDLVMRELKLSTRAEAAQWLEDEGFIRSDREPRPKTNGKSPGDPTGTPTEKYHYINLEAECLFYVQRYENPKDFRPFLPSGKKGLPDRSKLIVYRLPEITEAVSVGRTIYICEGEKDVHTAVDRLKIDATCNQGGCGGGWLEQYNETLRGVDVVVIPRALSARRRSPRASPASPPRSGS
jgi:putative DNA primase/helicase